jgi:hypothetical protein
MIAPLLVAGALIGTLAAQQPQEKIDAAMNARIRAEGMDHSQIMRIEHMLTDVYGPRPTGSPNHENAAKWAAKEMTSWGMTNAKLEPWDFGASTAKPAGGWLPETASGNIISPVKAQLGFAVVPWSPSTKGTITAPAVSLVTPTGPEAPPAPAPTAGAPGGGGGRGGAAGPQFLGPTEAELNAYFAKMAPKVKGAIVLVGASRVAPFVEVEPAKRADDAATRARFNPAPNAPPPPSRGGGAGRGAAPAPAPGDPVRLTAAQVNQRVSDFLMTNGAAMRVNDANRQHGIIVAQNPPAYDSSKQLPSVILRNEDYGRISRILADGTPVTLEFNIVNHDYPEGKTSYNIVAEIPGTDKKDEVVMLGGHLDSWTSATGATDDGIGCAIMMEAVRILKAVGAEPRRTIRVGLWSGEEEGLLGSLAYVDQHFGSAETPKPEWAKLSAYWNIDTGTGLLHGASIFGPPEAAQVLAQFLKPWEEFKVYGATATTSRVVSGTDSTSFNHAGLPGMGASQDPIEYNSHTHHTNLDTYERILPEDVKRDAIVTASVVYHIAMRDAMMPRFAPDKMPALPAGRGGGPH